MVNKNSPIPLYIQVKESILKEIAAEKFLPDSQLPTEKELMEIYGVGRATVRAALSDLEYEGRIIKRRGIGTFVSPMSRTAGFEPLISLTYFLDRMGIKSDSIIVKNEPCPATDKELSLWADDFWVHHIKRLRYADNLAVAIEDSFFVDKLYNIVKSIDSSSSVAHAILESDIKIDKIQQTIYIREADEHEIKNLPLGNSTSVIELTRWIYEKGDDTPVSFVRFVMPESLLEFPFSTLEKR